MSAREEVGFEATEEYIHKRQSMVTQFIAMWSLLDLCEEMDRTTGAQVGMRWWGYAELYLVGARESALAAEEPFGERMLN